MFIIKYVALIFAIIYTYSNTFNAIRYIKAKDTSISFWQLFIMAASIVTFLMLQFETI